MPLQRVQAVTGTNTSFASSVTSDSFTSKLGNFLVAVVEADVVAQNGITVTDNKGNPWSRAVSVSLASIFDLEIWYAPIQIGGSGHTVTGADNGGGVDSVIIVEEWSNVNFTSPYDVSTGASDNTGTSTALNSGATESLSVEDELVICAGVISAAGVSLSLGSGYSNLTTASTSFSILGLESKVISGTKDAQTGLMTANSVSTWICNVATFRQENDTNIGNYPKYIKVGQGMSRSEGAK